MDQARGVFSVTEQRTLSCATTPLSPIMDAADDAFLADYYNYLNPSSEAGPDYVQLPSQCEEIERTRRRHEDCARLDEEEAALADKGAVKK